MNKEMEIFKEYHKCYVETCKISKELQEELDEKVNEKLAKIEEIKKKHSDNFMSMYKEMVKVSGHFLKDMKKWKNYDEINIHNDCIKKNCKVFLIHFLKKTVPILQEQIKFFSVFLNIKTLSPDKKQLFKVTIRKLKSTIKSFENIDTWTDKKFDKILYNLFSVKDISKIDF
jgi:hypothetical protein